MATLFEAFRHATRKVDWEFMDREVYCIIFDITSNDSDTDSVSSSLYLVEIVMELSANSFSEEVLSYDSFFLDGSWVDEFRDGLEMSNISNVANIILEPYFPSKKVCMRWPPGVPNQHFYFYHGVIDNFGIGVSFTIFQFELLKVLNVAPSKLQPNISVFSREYEVACWELNIMPIIGFLFSFYEAKGIYKRGSFGSL